MYTVVAAGMNRQVDTEKNISDVAFLGRSCGCRPKQLGLPQNQLREATGHYNPCFFYIMWKGGGGVQTYVETFLPILFTLTV